MESILPTSDYKEVEGRLYLNPEVALNEANQFIDNLRSTQNQQNQEIAQQTYNLGTSLPSSQGGLGTNTANNMSYFTSRYQVPQTNSVVSDLRATAQAAALNQILANEQEMYKKRYNDAYRSYQKRSGNGSGGGSGGGSNGGNESTWDGDVTDQATDLTAEETFSLSSDTPGDTGPGIKWVPNMATVGTGRMEYYRIDENKDKSDPEYQTLYRQQDDGTLVRVR